MFIFRRTAIASATKTMPSAPGAPTGASRRISPARHRVELDFDLVAIDDTDVER